MPLPAPVFRQFAKIPANPPEAEFHGPYNTLLFMVFPPGSRFTIIPQYITPDSGEPADLIFRFEVMFDDLVQPVFVMELKAPSDLSLPSRREIADLQIRQYLEKAKNCPLPILYGASAIGTRLAFYSKEGNGDVNPLQIVGNPEVVTDVAPQALWNYDILTEQGFRKFEDIMNEIKRGCDILPVKE